MEPTYNELVGARLRSIRKQRGLSLQDVQRLSSGEFKAAVVGAYERGERSLSLPRLRRLADFFQVPLTQFLPQEEKGERTMTPLPSGGVTIDLNRMEGLSGTEAAMFDRFLRSIQMMRQDFNGKVLTIRRDDLRLLALLLEQSEEAFNKKLIELGLTTDSI
ncbi:MAG TPA: helix-turn-helix domain-containing protein [Gemmatimonadales bacterium]|nr:helix-turn-helix domain-containing protein [Gemmatimonadales bacterium]